MKKIVLPLELYETVVQGTNLLSGAVFKWQDGHVSDCTRAGNRAAEADGVLERCGEAGCKEGRHKPVQNISVAILYF